MLKFKKLYDSSLIIITADHSIGAADFAMNSPFPVNEDLFTNVYI